MAEKWSSLELLVTKKCVSQPVCSGLEGKVDLTPEIIADFAQDIEIEHWAIE